MIVSTLWAEGFVFQILQQGSAAGSTDGGEGLAKEGERRLHVKGRLATVGEKVPGWASQSLRLGFLSLELKFQSLGLIFQSPGLKILSLRLKRDCRQRDVCVPRAALGVRLR